MLVYIISSFKYMDFKNKLQYINIFIMYNMNIIFLISIIHEHSEEIII